jgi:hypothetical protein
MRLAEHIKKLEDALTEPSKECHKQRRGLISHTSDTPTVDNRIIRPPSLKLLDFEADDVEYSHEVYLGDLKLVPLNLVGPFSYEDIIHDNVKYPEGMDDDEIWEKSYYTAELLPQEPAALCHQASLKIKQGIAHAGMGRGSLQSEQLVRTGVLGSPLINDPTYLKLLSWFEQGDNGLCGLGDLIFMIDNAELLKRRHIFADPESLFTPEERGNTFVVMGGIPRESITGFKYIGSDPDFRQYTFKR